MVTTEIVTQVLDLAIKIQQIPAPTFEEHRRAAFIYAAFQHEGLTDVYLDDLGNVYGKLPGNGQHHSHRPLVISAHLDTVFPALTDLSYRREVDKIYGPGIGDNSLGVAGLFGLLWALRNQSELPGDVWLVANVCEEGLGDLKGMKAVVDRFGVDVLAYIVLEGMSLGQVYHCGLGVRRYRIKMQTDGGHSWVDFGRPSAIHEMAGLITRLTALPLSTHPRTTMNIGVIAGGTSVNTIAAQAQIELDLRSESPISLANLIQKVENLVLTANRTDVQVTFEIIGDRPVGKIPGDHPLVQLAAHCLLEVGVPPRLVIGSTDANVPLSRNIPAVCIGLSTGHGAHTLGEYVNTAPLLSGLSQLIRLVQGVYEDSFDKKTD